MTMFNGSVIEGGKLILVRSDKGGIQHRYHIGIRQVRRDIQQIETSSLPLKNSTRSHLAVLKEAEALWNTREQFSTAGKRKPPENSPGVSPIRGFLY